MIKIITLMMWSVVSFVTTSFAPTFLIWFYMEFNISTILPMIAIYRIGTHLRYRGVTG